MFPGQRESRLQRAERGFLVTGVNRGARRCEVHRDAEKRALDPFCDDLRAANLRFGPAAVAFGSEQLRRDNAREAFQPRYPQFDGNRERHLRFPAGTRGVTFQGREPAPQVVDEGLIPAAQTGARGFERPQFGAGAVAIAGAQRGCRGDHAQPFVVAHGCLLSRRLRDIPGRCAMPPPAIPSSRWPRADAISMAIRVSGECSPESRSQRAADGLGRREIPAQQR